MIKGIDVSHWQDSQTIKRAYEEIGIQFCMIKASEGKTYRDDKAALHYKACLDNGILPGFYHYARAEKNSPEEEAQNFVITVDNIVMLAHDGVPLALDFEGKCFNLTPDRQNEWALTFCDTVYRLSGVRPLLYVQESKIKNFPGVAAGNYGLWVAKWSTNKPKVEPWRFYAMWQSGKKRLTNGVEVDYNAFNGNADQYCKYGHPELG